MCDYNALTYLSRRMYHVYHYILSSYILLRVPVWITCDRMINPDKLDYFRTLVSMCSVHKCKRGLPVLINMSRMDDVNDIDEQVINDIRIGITAMVYLVLQQIVQDESISLCQVRDSLSAILWTLDSGGGEEYPQ